MKRWKQFFNLQAKHRKETDQIENISNILKKQSRSKENIEGIIHENKLINSTTIFFISFIP